jgi:hypothetical protein
LLAPGYRTCDLGREEIINSEEQSTWLSPTRNEDF